jgi:hypothetical protein
MDATRKITGFLMKIYVVEFAFKADLFVIKTRIVPAGISLIRD